MIKIQIQLSPKDFRKANLNLLYQKLSIKVLTAFGILFLLLTILQIALLGFDTKYAGQIGAGLGIVVFLPLVIIYKAKLSYKSNPKVREPITYEFNNDGIKISGSSFNAEMNWDSLYKVTERKEWIFLWQSKQIANTIPIRYFKPDELIKFRELVRSKTSLKQKLKA